MPRLHEVLMSWKITIKVYDNKAYCETVYMRYGTIEDEGCAVICVGCAINIIHLSFPIVQYLK